MRLSHAAHNLSISLHNAMFGSFSPGPLLAISVSSSSSVWSFFRPQINNLLPGNNSQLNINPLALSACSLSMSAITVLFVPLGLRYCIILTGYVSIATTSSFSAVMPQEGLIFSFLGVCIFLPIKSRLRALQSILRAFW